MTTSTIKTLSAKELLKDWYNGTGSTSDRAWDTVQDTTGASPILFEQSVRVEQLVALCSKYLKDTPSFRKSIADGYLSETHWNQDNLASSKNNKPANTVLKNHAISPLDHLKYILTLALDNLTMASGEALLSITHVHELVSDDDYEAGIRHIEEYKRTESEKQTVRSMIDLLLAENFYYIKHEGLVISLLSPAGYSNKSIEEALDNSGMVRVAWINHDMEADVKTFTCTAKVKVKSKSKDS